MTISTVAYKTGVMWRPLSSQIVIGILHVHSWQIATDYDIHQRELATINKVHDYSMIDGNVVSLITTRATLKSVKEVYLGVC
jgi:hypothetical protein